MSRQVILDALVVALWVPLVFFALRPIVRGAREERGAPPRRSRIRGRRPAPTPAPPPVLAGATPEPASAPPSSALATAALATASPGHPEDAWDDEEWTITPQWERGRRPGSVPGLAVAAIAIGGLIVVMLLKSLL